jgi:NADPH2:quinone reductase
MPNIHELIQVLIFVRLILIEYLIPLPESISFEVGASMLLQGLTAVALTKQAYCIKPGDTVLIHAAAGGTGLLLVQLAKFYGATVIGTTSTPAKAEVAKAAGVDHIILYTQEDVATRVMELTQNVGVDAVYDGVGKSTFDVSLKCLKRLGFMLSFGNASGKVDDVPIMKLVPKAIRLMRPSLYEFLKNKQDFDECIILMFRLIRSDTRIAKSHSRRENLI